MATVKKNLGKFEEYKDLQSKIEWCGRVIAELLPQEKRRISMYYTSIQENLGEHLSKVLCKDIIKLVKAEQVRLRAEQDVIELDC